MTGNMDHIDLQHLERPENRARRLNELEADIQSLEDRMRELTNEIRQLLRRAGGYGYQHAGEEASMVTVRVRLQDVTGSLSIRYTAHDEDAGKSMTRAMLVEFDEDGNAVWLFVLKQSGMQEELLTMDRTRRILNHRYRSVNAEKRSLERLLQEELDLRSATNSKTR